MRKKVKLWFKRISFIAIVGLFLLGFVADADGFISMFGRIKCHISECSKVIEEPPVSPVLSLEDAVTQEKAKGICSGTPLSVVEELKEIGGERFFKEKVGVSAKNTQYFQATARTPLPCSLPFIATLVFKPVSGTSLGAFIEIEGIYRVVVGDGDKRSVRVEENKWSNRGGWVTVPEEKGGDKQYLTNPIEDGEEVTVILKSWVQDGWMHAYLEIHHSKNQNSEVFNYRFLPDAVNFSAGQKRHVRAGLNDSVCQGMCSVLDLQTLSVEQIK